MDRANATKYDSFALKSTDSRVKTLLFLLLSTVVLLILIGIYPVRSTTAAGSVVASLTQTATSTPQSELAITATAAQRRIDQLVLADSQRLVNDADRILRLDGNAEVASLLDIRAYRASPQPEIAEALRRALAADNVGPFVPAGNRFSADGKSLVALSCSGYCIQIYNIASGKMTTHPLDQLPIAEKLYWNVFSPDGRYVIGGGQFDIDHVTRIWNAATGKLLNTI
ncbi:MAG: hypothetical protein ABI947_00200 [Chloroflexota bacterium]